MGDHNVEKNENVTKMYGKPHQLEKIIILVI